MERQVSILRDRGLDARIKLNTLLNTARDNDQLFEVTREIVFSVITFKRRWRNHSSRRR